MNNQYILFYSDKCKYCTDLIQILYKNQELYEKIIKIDINKKNINIPQYIKSVPSMLINVNNKRSLLCGNDLFQWCDKTTGSNNQNNSAGNNVDSIKDWDPTAMGGTSYSDSFAYLDNGDATIKNFSFIGCDSDKINCPNEDSQIINNNNKPAVSKDFERLMQQRQMDEPQQIARI